MPADKPAIHIATEQELADRAQRKSRHIKTIAKNIQWLRYRVSKDLKSDNEKDALTALAVKLMDMTAERVGNEDSASAGHYGVTWLLKRHVTISTDSVTLKYKGKSGVEQEKVVTNSDLAKYLKKAIKNSPEKYVFVTSDGFKIRADRINRYLHEFNVTAKDIRGYAANKWIYDKLSHSDIPATEPERKRKFSEVAKQVAEKVGHSTATLKKHYLIPTLQDEYITKGKLTDIKDIGRYAYGGVITQHNFFGLFD